MRSPKTPWNFRRPEYTTHASFWLYLSNNVILFDYPQLDLNGNPAGNNTLTHNAYPYFMTNVKDNSFPWKNMLQNPLLEVHPGWFQKWIGSHMEVLRWWKLWSPYNAAKHRICSKTDANSEHLLHWWIKIWAHGKSHEKTASNCSHSTLWDFQGQ